MVEDEGIGTEEDRLEEEPERTDGWVDPDAQPRGTVHIDTGRGQTSEVPVGAPFQETLERVAEATHYGGFFRVFLNGEEILDPERELVNEDGSAKVIESGMRIAITSYDKVGAA